MKEFCIHDGNPRFTLTWDGIGDLDLHVKPPCGGEISHKNKNPGGVADGTFESCTNVENIYFPLATNVQKLERKFDEG